MLTRLTGSRQLHDPGAATAGNKEPVPRQIAGEHGHLRIDGAIARDRVAAHDADHLACFDHLRDRVGDRIVVQGLKHALAPLWLVAAFDNPVAVDPIIERLRQRRRTERVEAVQKLVRRVQPSPVRFEGAWAAVHLDAIILSAVTASLPVNTRAFLKLTKAARSAVNDRSWTRLSRSQF